MLHTQLRIYVLSIAKQYIQKSTKIMKSIPEIHPAIMDNQKFICEMRAPYLDA